MLLSLRRGSIVSDYRFGLHTVTLFPRMYENQGEGISNFTVKKSDTHYLGLVIKVNLHPHKSR